MEHEEQAHYAMQCIFGSGPIDYDDVFFVTFNTRNEDEARRLVSCICGKKSAKNNLVVLDGYGEVYLI